MLSTKFKPVPYFDFNLDLPGKKRWIPIFDAFSPDQLTILRSHAKTLLKPYENVLNMASMAMGYYPEDNIMYLAELTYIAKRMDMKLIEIIVLQLVYEASSACTTAIWSVNDSSYFLRTMDWEMSYLKDFTIGLNVSYKGEPITKAITWLGIVGFFTACSLKNDYSVAINYRRTQSLCIKSIMANVVRTLAGAFPISYLVRSKINDETIDVNDAISLFETFQLISPCYITVYNHVNVKKSVIITRDCDHLVNTRHKHLIQANCDYDATTPDIMWSLERVRLSKKLIDEKKVKMEDYMLHPILNQHTIYTYFASGENSVAVIN